jgi:hypothetical protein
LDTLWRYASLVFGGFGLILISGLLAGMARYSDVCERLLHGQVVPNMSHVSDISSAINLSSIGMLLFVAGIAIFIRRKDFAALQLDFNEQRSPVIRGVWESLGLGMDAPMAMFYTYVWRRSLALSERRCYCSRLRSSLRADRQRRTPKTA